MEASRSEYKIKVNYIKIYRYIYFVVVIIIIKMRPLVVQYIGQ